MRSIRRPKVDYGLSILLSDLYSLHALESRVGGENGQCVFDQCLIDGGMAVLGPVACVHCLLCEEEWFLRATCSVQPSSLRREYVCTKPDGSAA